MGRKWVKLWCENDDDDLTLEEDGFWLWLLKLAGRTDADGLIYIERGIAFEPFQLAKLMKSSKQKIKMLLLKFVELDRITINEDKTISINSWKHYQSEYMRQRDYRTPEFRGLRDAIKERDDYICQDCHKTEEELKVPLCIHHIDNDPDNNDLDNLITLCMTCHSQLLKKAVHKTKNAEREEQAEGFKAKVQEKVQQKGSRESSTVERDIDIDIDKEVEEEVNSIYMIWNTQEGLVTHRTLNDATKSAIRAALKTNDVYEICDAISTYADICNSDDYYFTYSGWTLKQFLQGHLDAFRDGDKARKRYLKDDKHRSGPINTELDNHRKYTYSNGATYVFECKSDDCDHTEEKWFKFRPAQGQECPECHRPSFWWVEEKPGD